MELLDIITSHIIALTYHCALATCAGVDKAVLRPPFPVCVVPSLYFPEFSTIRLETQGDLEYLCELSSVGVYDAIMIAPYSEKLFALMVLMKSLLDTTVHSPKRINKARD